jgi:hypothetical protein
VNLSDFYSYSVIGKLTVSLQVQEFRLRKMIVVSSTSTAHTHPSHSQNYRLLTSSLSLGIPVPPINPVYSRHVGSSSLGFSLSSHRQSYIGLVFSSRFYRLIIKIKNKKKLSVSRFIINNNARCVNRSALDFSLSSHRHSYISFLFSPHFIP